MEDRTDIGSIECSESTETIDEVLSAEKYAAADFVDAPSAVCVVELDSGRTIDLLRVRGRWVRR